MRLPRSRWSLAMTQAWVACLASQTFMRMGASPARGVFPRKRESSTGKLDLGSSELMSKRVHAMTTSRDTRTLIQTIVKKLIAEYAPKQVILFGSYAYGTPGPDSDIDLLIIKETPERFIDRWVAVKRILTGTHPSVPLDAIVLTPDELGRRLAVGDQFIEEVFNKGEVLYAA